MSNNGVEKLGDNKYKLTFSVGAEEFNKGLNASFEKNQKKFNIKGFRKGKVPRAIIEQTYGESVLFDDAFDFVLRDSYPEVLDKSDLDVVSKPEIDVVSASKKDGAVFTAIVYTKPQAKVEDYKGLSYEKVNDEVTDEDIQEQLNKEAEKHSRVESVTDRPVQDGDLANINFEGFMDGVAFEGGKGEDYDLEIGSKTFIDTFEEQIVGKNIGDEFDVNVTFPENYGQEHLANKPAVFKVKVNEINKKTLPEINDEFAKDTSEFDTLEEYKADVKTKLETAKQSELENQTKEQVLEALIDKTTVEIPKPMLELEIDSKINEFRNGISRQGLTIDAYLEYMGQSMENMREAYKMICEKQIKSRLALEAVALAENIQVTDGELQKELESIANSYKLEVEKINEIFGEKEKQNIVNDVKSQKALDFLIENAKAE
ncbi:MAG: trigger factor [bacterium]